jgi:hypothetical protein
METPDIASVTHPPRCQDMVMPSLSSWAPRGPPGRAGWWGTRTVSASCLRSDCA